MSQHQREESNISATGSENEKLAQNPDLTGFPEIEGKDKANTAKEESEGWGAGAVEGDDNSISPVFSAGKRRNDWQIFTSHGLVLISILNNPGRTVREIGLELNLTDRAIALALADLVEDGYLVRERVGRRTFYHVFEEHPLRYPVSPFDGGSEEKPQLTVKALRAENLATHAQNKTKTGE